MLVLDGIGGVDLRGVKGGLTKLVRVGRGKGHMLFWGISGQILAFPINESKKYFPPC